MTRNTSVTRTAPRSWEGCRPMSNDERRAEWASRYFSSGCHRKKPRIRVKPRIRIVND